jgi:autotransporter-associated beta strand protein
MVAVLKLRHRLLFPSILLALFAGTDLPLPGQTINATVDPTTVLVTNYEGWGTSLCWWANVVGGYSNRTDYISLAFTTLKLNIVRYNIGGGENPGIPDTLQYRARIPGFEPTNGVWNWNVDANQRWVLKQAVALGANHVEAFANSPPWWMTVSGSVTGAMTNGHNDNLQTDYETNFAFYLATVVSNLSVLDGINFELVTPMNEPEGPWGYGGGQEGCHMDSGQQGRMVGDLSAALSAQKLATGIDAPETYDEPDASSAVGAYGSAQGDIMVVTSHAYGTKNPASLGSLAASLHRPVWLSEYGDGDGSGMTMARRIHDDVTGAGLSAWIYWQVVDNASGWGFLLNTLDDEVTTNYTINEKFYVMGQFSEYIRPGCRIINVNDNYSLAAYNPTNQTLVIVALNDTSGSLNLNYSLANFTGLPATGTVLRTAATGNLNLASQPAVTVANKSFSTTLIPYSVTTYIFNNVLTAPLAAPGGFSAVFGNSQAVLSWNAVAGATNYTVLRGTSSGNETFTADSTPGTTFTDTGMLNGTTYYYVVYATGPAGSSLDSMEISGAPFVGPPAVYWTNIITSAAQSWNLNANWNNNAAFPNAVQATAVVSAAIAANQTIDLNQTNTVGALNTGAGGGSFNLTANGGALTFDNTPGQAALLQLASSRGDTLSAPVQLNSYLNLSNASASGLTLAGTVSGTNGMAILGPGTVILTASNGFSGGTSVVAGTLDLANQGAAQNGTLTMKGGALVFDSSVSGKAFNVGGLAAAASGTGYDISLVNNGGAPVALTVGWNNTTNIYAGTLTGGGSLTTVGTSSQTIGSGASGGASYAGATTLLGGTLTMGGIGSMTTSGTLDISGNSGACNLIIADSAVVTTIGAILIADGAGNGYPAVGTMTVKNNASLRAASLTFGGNYAGRIPNGSFVTVQDNGALTISGSFDVNKAKGGSTSENDQINLNGGTLTVGNFLDSASTGNIGNTHTATINFNGGVLKADANDPSGSVFLPAFAAGYLAVEVGSGGAIINPNGYIITIAAPLAHGGGSPDGGLTLTGTGTLTLTGSNTYNGNTDLAGGVLDFATGALGTGGVTFDAGTLQWAAGNTTDISAQTVLVNPGGGTLNVNGNSVTLAGPISGDGALTLKSTTANGRLTLLGTNTCSGALTVTGGSTLGGTGTYSGAVIVNSGGAMTPGNPYGNLTISNNLTLAAGSTTFVQIQHSPLTNSAVRISGSLTEGGALNVFNSSVAAFTAGDSFKLFYAGSYSGNFAGFVLPALTGNLLWNTNTLKSTGTLSVVALTSPTISGVQIAGGGLVISGSGGVNSWPYVLEVSTNPAAAQWTPVATNQFDAFGNFTLTNFINQDSTQAFYRLQLQ